VAHLPAGVGRTGGSAVVSEFAPDTPTAAGPRIWNDNWSNAGYPDDDATCSATGATSFTDAACAWAQHRPSGAVSTGCHLVVETRTKWPILSCAGERAIDVPLGIRTCPGSELGFDGGGRCWAT